MKKFVMPEMDVETFVVEDIITTSGGITGDGTISGTTPEEDG